ncbi:hypothetical protein ACM55F_06975 [Flavobacterium sp. XS2P12]|uniref:hypothetical protein n=1 Tax=Flavobacterium melibiosi TaxID=3398734 RepID=UPI003A83DD26
MTGGNFWQGAVTGLVVSGLNHAFHTIDPPGGKKPKVVDNNKEAVEHYYEDGSPVELGPNTKLALLNDKDYRRVLGALKAGTAVSRTDKFDIHFTWKVFHIGDSNVNYSTSCTTGNCTTRFSAFVGDGFRDPLDLGFETSFNSGDVNFMAKPYNYIPYNFSVSYPNPGYPVGTNIK